MTARLAYRFTGWVGCETVTCGACARSVIDSHDPDQPTIPPLAPAFVVKGEPGERCDVCGRLLAAERRDRWRDRWVAESEQLGTFVDLRTRSGRVGWMMAADTVERGLIRAEVLS